MGLVIIFALVALLGLAATLRAFKDKNILAILFAGGSTVVFGWFAIMTVVNSGFPTLVH